MKFHFISLALFCTQLLQAQSPLLSKANVFEAGDSLLRYNATNVTIGVAGANVTWNFSALNFSTNPDTVIYLNPVGTPFYPTAYTADYSKANLCALVKSSFGIGGPGDNDYSYFNSSSDSLVFLGHWANNGVTEIWEDNYPNPIKNLVFPTAYLNNFTDAFTRYYNDLSGSQGHYIKGNTTVMVDGYGELVLPGGDIIDNVLRVHITENYRDSNALFGVNDFTRNFYQWYSADKKGFIVSIETSSDGSTLNVEYQKQINKLSSTSNILENSTALVVSPNPSTGQLDFSISKDQGFISIMVLNTLGHLVYSKPNVPCQMNNTLDLSTLEKGMYFLKIQHKGVIYSKKIAIQ